MANIILQIHQYQTEENIINKFIYSMSSITIKTAAAIILAFLISAIDAFAQIDIQAKDIYKIKFVYEYKHIEYCNSINTEEDFLYSADDYTTIYNRRHIKQFVKILNSLEESSEEIKDYRIMVELIHYSEKETKMFFTYFYDWGLLYYNDSQMYISNRKLVKFFDRHLYKHWRSPIPPIPKKLLRDKK